MMCQQNIIFNKADEILNPKRFVKKQNTYDLLGSSFDSIFTHPIYMRCCRYMWQNTIGYNSVTYHIQCLGSCHIKILSHAR